MASGERMASSSPAKKTEPAVKYVQQFATNGKEPPDIYCYKDGVSRGLDTPRVPIADITTIDMALLASPSPSRPELDKLHSALTSLGCFMAINHGMTNSFIEEVCSASKRFFALPMEEKQKYAKDVESREGYGHDMVFAQNQVQDWNDRLVLSLIPEDQRQLRFWPQNPANFIEVISEYTTKLQQMTEAVLKAMAMSLNLDEQCFLKKCGIRARMGSRFNLYPPCSRYDRVLGMKPHSDSSAITFVLQDTEVEGLQIRKDDQWFRVPIVPETLLINIGDQAEIMSNGLFKSTIHRVVLNPERERWSLAVFYYADADNDIEHVDELVDETRPKQYKMLKNYFASYVQYYQQGKRLIEAIKI